MPPLLSFDGVAKSHWRGALEVSVFSDVSLSLSAGELLAVWGSRGTGKSTLVRLAVGQEKPDRGTIAFRGRPLDFPDDLHRHIGWARRSGPRSPDFEKIADFVGFPLIGAISRRKARRRAIAVLDRFSVADCADAVWRELSDGQRTLVAMAHAFVREPSVVVIDDPTASLNILQREEVMRLLRSACDEEQVGVLVAVPDVPDLAHADRVAMLDGSTLMFPEPERDPAEKVVRLHRRQQSA